MCTTSTLQLGYNVPVSRVSALVYNSSQITSLDINNAGTAPSRCSSTTTATRTSSATAAASWSGSCSASSARTSARSCGNNNVGNMFRFSYTTDQVGARGCAVVGRAAAGLQGGLERGLGHCGRGGLPRHPGGVTVDTVATTTSRGRLELLL